MRVFSKRVKVAAFALRSFSSNSFASWTCLCNRSINAWDACASSAFSSCKCWNLSLWQVSSIIFNRCTFMYVRFMSCSGVTLRCSFHCLSSSCTHAHEPFYECVELPSTSSVTEWHLHLALKLCCQLNHNMILSFTCSGRPLTSLNLQHFSVCSLPKKNCYSSTK